MATPDNRGELERFFRIRNGLCDQWLYVHVEKYCDRLPFIQGNVYLIHISKPNARICSTSKA
jgi:hypothetical protein